MTMNDYRVLASPFNRNAFRRRHGRAPVDDIELINWVLDVVEEIKAQKACLSMVRKRQAYQKNQRKN